MLRGCLVTLLAIGALIAVAIGSAWFLLTKDYELDGDFRIRLPSAMGESLAGHFAGRASFEPGPNLLHIQGQVEIPLNAIAISLPTKTYSILDSNLASPHVSSMLGRIHFEHGTAALRNEGSTLFFSAELRGDFLVRARQNYDRDEEQPDAGTAKPVSGLMEVRMTGLQLTPAWRPQANSIEAAYKLDALSVRTLQGQFGPDDSLASLIEGLLSRRLRATLERYVGKTALDPRQMLQDQFRFYARSHAHKMWAPLLYHLTPIAILVDRCPSFEPGLMLFWITTTIKLEEQARLGVLPLPDLELREGNCQPT